MEKSSDAFRTISEVAEDLALPQHVLRFWETKFPHIRPLKRAGGRRYYRPTDVVLLRTIRQLLYDEGYTIKGVQKLLKEQGARSFRTGVVPTAELPDFDMAPGSDADLDMSVPATPAQPQTLPPQPVAGPAHPQAPPAAPAWEPPPQQRTNRAELLDLLAIVDECSRILAALRPPPPR